MGGEREHKNVFPSIELGGNNNGFPPRPESILSLNVFEIPLRCPAFFSFSFCPDESAEEVKMEFPSDPLTNYSNRIENGNIFHSRGSPTWNDMAARWIHRGDDKISFRSFFLYKRLAISLKVIDEWRCRRFRTIFHLIGFGDWFPILFDLSLIGKFFN